MYVVDVFQDSRHAEHHFNTEEKARKFAKMASKYGIVFLLEETTSPGIYDVVELIEEQEVRIRFRRVSQIWSAEMRCRNPNKERSAI